MLHGEGEVFLCTLVAGVPVQSVTETIFGLTPVLSSEHLETCLDSPFNEVLGTRVNEAHQQIFIAKGT
jgi:hypothetical protein